MKKFLWIVGCVFLLCFIVLRIGCSDDTSKDAADTPSLETRSSDRSSNNSPSYPDNRPSTTGKPSGGGRSNAR